MTDHSFDEWTPEEREQLTEVGRHRSPRSELKGRTMRTLRERGLLGAVELPRPRRQFAFGLAAAIVIFAAGMLAGYSVGLRRQVEGGGASSTAAANTGGPTPLPTREVSRLDSPSTQSSASGRHVVWF
jgi:hypothetical protein